MSTADGATAPDSGRATARRAEQGRCHREVFEGPFDLLLELISRRELDVSQVDLAELTADYLARLRRDEPARPDRAGPVDLEETTYFLVVVATLVEAKAARLLSSEDGQLDELLAEARDVLYARLLEYRAFRHVAALLAERFEDNAGYVAREAAADPGMVSTPETRLGTTPAELAEMAACALAEPAPPHIDVDRLRKSYRSIRDAAARLLARVTAETPCRFDRLTDDLTSPDRVVHFLALLELYKLGALELEQPVRFGPVLVRRAADVQLDISAVLARVSEF